MANNGSGQPYFFGCARCRSDIKLSIRLGERKLETNLVRTGRVRPLHKTQQGHGGRRVLQERHEYKCLACQHVGWTRNKDILRFKVVS